MKFTRIERLCNAVRRATGKMIVVMLMTGVLWFASMERAGAEVSTTTVQGTVYLANGHPGSGMLHVSWPAFMSANGQAIVADSVDVTIGEDGFMTVNLAPNQGAMPAGLFYTAVFYMNDGSVSTQYWVVPAAAQATLAQVQAQVMPAAQAVQVVDKLYVDGAIARLSQSTLAGSGGTLTGPLYLSGDPTQPLQAADKHYVDLAVSQASGSNVSPATAGQVAVYSNNGTSISGISTVPVSAGGTGSATANEALENLGGISANESSAQSMAGPLYLSGPYDASMTNPNQAASAQNVRNATLLSVKEFGAKGNGIPAVTVAAAGSHTIALNPDYTCCGFNFTPDVVGDLISIPGADSDHKNLYTIITGYIDSMHVTVADAPTYSVDSSSMNVSGMWMHDDLAAINAAIYTATHRAAGEGYGNGGIYFPCGVYGVSQQISVPDGVHLKGESSSCVRIMYMGNTAADATVEPSYAAGSGGGTGFMRQGFYLTPVNHLEIGPACTGTDCSPSIGNYVSGVAEHLTIYGSKWTNWAFSIISPSNYYANDLNMYSGNMGCFYHFNDVQTTYIGPRCSNEYQWGVGKPRFGIYSDGTGVGEGGVPMKMQSPWVTDATEDALVFNFFGLATISDGQLSQNHRSLNILTGGGFTFERTLFEWDTLPPRISGANTCIGCAFGNGIGVDIYGSNNVFIDSGFPNGTLTIESTANHNTFINPDIWTNVIVDDQSGTSRFINTFGVNVGTREDFPQEQTAMESKLGDPVVVVSGKWSGTATSDKLIATTKLTTGKAWKAIFIGNWSYYGTQTAIPPFLELTDAANTVTVGATTFTFTIDANGHFMLHISGADSWQGFSGTIYIMPRNASPGAGGSNSMQLAGNIKAASMQVGSGVAMTANHGTGTSVQHSDGTGTAGGLAVYAADGSVTAGPTPPTGALVGTTDTQTLTNKSIAGSEINSGTVGVAYGGTGQNESTATGIGQFNAGTYNVSTTLANGTTATTQSAGDNSSKVATTSYVASPGAIAPTVVTATGIITGGNDTTRTTSATIGTTGFSSTGLVLPTVPANTTKSGRCVVLWQMSTTGNTATFGMGMSNAPVGLWGGSSITYAAAGTSNWLAFSQTATAPTSISTAATAAAANATYRAEIDFTLQTGASNPVTITLYGLVNQATATLSIQSGSACYWLP